MRASYSIVNDNYMPCIVHLDGRRETIAGPPLAMRRSAIKYAQIEINRRNTTTNQGGYMNYTILAKNGWKEKAHTIQQAHEKAIAFKQDWASLQVEMQVSIYYYDGTLVEQF